MALAEETPLSLKALTLTLTLTLTLPLTLTLALTLTLILTLTLTLSLTLTLDEAGRKRHFGVVEFASAESCQATHGYTPFATPP